MATINNDTTSFEDIHRDIIQTHILPLLDGPSLSNSSCVSSYLQFLCSDHNLWSHISKSTWPSITDPRVDDVISTFPSRHRSFYNDSYPSLVTDVRELADNVPYFHQGIDCTEKVGISSLMKCASAIRQLVYGTVFDALNEYLQMGDISKKDTSSCYLNTSCHKLISAVDIRYQGDIFYSQVIVTDMSANNLSSGLEIELPGSPQLINVTVDEIVGADKATLVHLKESLTLTWILIDPALNRAGNVSSIKPVSVKQDWATNETHVRYVTILRGRDPNEIVKCRIHMALGVGKRGVGLHAKELTLKLEDFDYNCLNGMDFMVIMQRAIMEENYVKRKVIVDDEKRCRDYKVFKELKKAKKDWVKKKQQKMELKINLSYFGVVLSFLLSFYYLIKLSCIG